MPKEKNSLSFELDVDSDVDLRDQVEDQLKDNGYSEDEINDEEFQKGLDDIYGEDEDEDDQADDEQDEDDVDEDNQDSSTDEDSNKDVKDENQSTEEQEQEEERKGRANKRIRELNEQKNKAWQEAEQARKERFEAEKTALETKEELLVLKRDSLKRDYEAAINDGDASKQVEITAKLAEIGMEISNVSAKKEQFKEYKPSVKTQKEQDVAETDVFGLEYNQEQALKLASDWEFENPRVLTDKAFHDTSVRIGRMLIDRGMKPDTQKFYDELSHRMSLAFGLPTKQKDETQQNKAESAKKEVVVAKKTPPVKKVQTVAGASRTSAPSSNPSNKNVVRLSREDVEVARRLGQDLQTFARNKARVEKNMKEDGSFSGELFPDDIY